MKHKKLKPFDLKGAYKDSYEKFGDTPAGVQWPRGRQEIRFNSLTHNFKKTGFFSVLDYGCGLGHLKPYLDARFPAYEYYGVDIVPEFIAAIRKKYPEISVNLINSFHDVSGNFDYIIISGVFNIRDEKIYFHYLQKVKYILKYLFSIAKISLSVNFMTDKVDYMQIHAMHFNPAEMTNFVINEITPRITLDASYMPYEYTITMFKDSEIIRPDNIYNPA